MTQHVPWTAASHHRSARHLIGRATPACRPALRAYARWLQQERGLLPASVTLRLHSAERFLRAVVGEGRSAAQRLRRLTALEVEEFFVDYGQHHGRSSLRSMQAAVRRFLEFSASRGWSSRDLRESVPRLPAHRSSGLPRAVEPRSLAALLRTVRKTRTARDQAVVLMLASYGVRRGHVCALRLRDVDWRRRQITFAAHKRGKPVVHELTPAVAEALSLYLRDERPSSNSEHVFLRGLAPHLPLGPSAVSQLVRVSLLSSGVTSAPLGPHGLRHAFATRMLRANRSLKTVADLLGHRSLDSAAIYAKVDRDRLAEVAAEWPEASS